MPTLKITSRQAFPPVCVNFVVGRYNVSQLVQEDHLPISCSQFLLASGEKLKQVGYF